MICLDDITLIAMLDDDCPFDDLTTSGLGIEHIAAKAILTARHDMVVCGVEEACRLFELAGGKATMHCKTGDQLAADMPIITVTGTAQALHRSYKTAQTFMEIFSGMATMAAQMVIEAQKGNAHCRVACTRKHMPGIKKAALKAIIAGGASPHRLGLSDSILVFDEHLALCQKDVPIESHIKRLRAYAPERKIAIESDTIEQALLYAQAGADIIQLDKVSADDLRLLKLELDKLPQKPLLCAAGGINQHNARLYAQAGADILVTSQPYYAPPRDVKVTVTLHD